MDHPLNNLPDRFNFAQHILTINSGRHGKTAYIDDAQQITYGEFDLRVRRVAAGLLKLGLRPEERVVLIMQDTVDMPVAMLGAMYAGIVPVPVNTLLPVDDYAYIFEHSGAKTVIVSAGLYATAQQAAAKSGLSIQFIVSGSVANTVPAPLPFSSLLAAAPLATDTCARTHPDHFAFWLYSSGSTGRPKGTVHSHANLFQTAALYGKPILGIQEEDIVFSAAKLFFAYGLGNSLTFPLSVGATTILMAERATPQAVFARLTTFKPTIFCGVPTLYAGMLASPDLPAKTMTALRLCASAGEALPRELGEQFHAHFGCHVLDGLGSTEMLHIFLSNREGDIRYGTTGKPVPGYDIVLRNDRGADEGADEGALTPPGEIGDLYIRGPSAAWMYWADHDKSRATFQGNWVKSGDKYKIDADGYYCYAGRSDDMLKVSGQYVSPIEVEAVLMQHPAVLECAVVGHLDEEGLTKTVAYVALKPDRCAAPELEAELKAFVKTRLAPHKYPREVIFVADLPKTATGKIQRFKLRALHT